MNAAEITALVAIVERWQLDRAGAYQAMELRKAHKQCRLLRAEIERLKAQAPPASEALIERLTDAVARLPERHELGDVRDAIAAALAAQAPPASDPPGLVANWRPIETAPKRTDVLAGWADRPHWLPQVLQQPGLYRQGQEDMRRRVLDIVRDPSDCRIVKKLPIWGVPGMSEAAAAVAPLVERAQQATGGSDASDFRMRQSDPPGLVAAVKELQDAYRECDYRDRVITQAACARADSAMAFVLAYDLTAPAQMPTKGGE